MSKPLSAASPVPRRTPSGPNFNRVARIYRWAEYLCLGPLLQHVRQAHLRQMIGARHALVLGDGDGRFLAALLRRSPDTRATAVDTSSVMLALLRRHCRFAAPRLTTLQADVCALVHIGPDLSDVDLIATHFFLDCLTQAQVQELAFTLARSVRPGTRWVVSDFAHPPTQPWRLLGGLYIRGLYHAFRVLTGLRVQALPEIASALSAAGFCRIHRIIRLRGLLYSELWQLPEARPKIQASAT